MTRKPKSPQSSLDEPLPAVAGMKFWSRFKNPPPMLAFTFAEPADGIDDSLDALTRLPEVPFDDSVVYSLRISLDDSKPPIWRRILVKSVNLEMLHHVIQLAMGWYDSHLHGFEVRKIPVPLVDDGAAVDERAISIAQLHAAKIKKIRYTYDFGDEWRHTVAIEDIFAAPIEAEYPQCIAGKGTCPLEDVGGIWQWSKLLEALQHPDNGRNDEIDALLNRVGEDYRPKPFDVKETNARLERAFNQRTRRKGRA